MANERAVFVTGATGFIGARLVEELVRRGERVRALVRRASRIRFPENGRATAVEGDILAPDTLERAMTGCSRAFHLAAYARNWARDPAVFFEHNVVGTRNVLAAARAGRLERVVVTSSIVTLGPTPPGAVGDEATVHAAVPPFTAYEESKAAAEREAFALAAQGAPVVVVNPTRVYGPGRLSEGNSVTTMIDLYRRGRFRLLLARGRNVGNYVLVDDLVRGLVLAMEHGRVGERYILGGANASLRDLFAVVDRLNATRHATVNLPAALATAYAHLAEAGGRWLGIYPRITPGWVRTFLHDWAFSSAKAERELGYSITPLEAGIRRTLEWLRARRPPQGKDA